MAFLPREKDIAVVGLEKTSYWSRYFFLIPFPTILISRLILKKVKAMEKDAPRLLRLSGYVPHNKRREFEQTCRFVFNQMTADCIERSLSADVFVEGYYHFFSLWRTEKHLDMFRASREFQLLIGTYIQLGLDAEKARQLW